MKKHYNITVKGKVQGVAYRYSAFQKAKELQLTGYARNCPDGSVEIEAEGEEHNLDDFYLWCKIGPARARVDNIFVSSGDILNYTDFKIR